MAGPGFDFFFFGFVSLAMKLSAKLLDSTIGLTSEGREDEQTGGVVYRQFNWGVQPEEICIRFHGN